VTINNVWDVFFRTQCIVHIIAKN